MRKWIPALFIGIAFSVPAMAQNTWKRASVVTSAGDTLRGQVDDRKWRHHPLTISFRMADQKTSRELTPAEVRRISIEGSDTYVSGTLELDQSPVEMRQLLEEGTEVYETKTVFLRMLYEGKRLSLLEVPEFTKNHFVIRDSAGRLAELVYQQLYAAGSRTNIQTINRFRGQLQAYLRAGNTSLHSRFQQLAYTAEELLWAVARINEDNGSLSGIRKNIVRKVVVSPFVAGGLGMNSTKFESLPNRGIPPGPGARSSFAAYGGIDVSEQQSLRNLFFRVSLLTNKYAYSEVVKLLSQDVLYRSDMNKLRVAISANYQKNFSKLSVYGGAGAAYQMVRHRNVSGFTGTQLSSNWLSPQVQAGLRFRPAFLHFEYHVPSGPGTELRSMALVAGVYF